MLRDVVKKAKRMAKGALSHLIKTKTIVFQGLKIEGAFQDFGLLNELSQGRREPFMTELFQKSLKKGDFFWDVGAHLGVYSLLAAQHGQVRVLALEPNPRTQEFLIRNIQNNRYMDKIQAYPLAISAQAGRLKFYCDDLESDVSSLIELENPGQLRAVEIETVTLDDLARKVSDYPTVMKIDVEGVELDVLRGGQGFWNTLRNRGSFHLFIESNSTALERAGASADELYRELEKIGFQVFIIDEESKSIAPVDERLASGCWNLYCKFRS